MHSRTAVLLAAVLCLATCRAAAQAPKPVDTVIRAESRLVLVDTVVTDKKGNYLRDLAPTEFHVWEDNREQTIKNVSRESRGDASASPIRLVLLFGRMGTGDATQARETVAQFIDANSSQNRPIALLQYGVAGTISVVQNFTTNPERLKEVTKNVKALDIGPDRFSGDIAAAPYSRYPTAGGPSGPQGAAVRLLLLAIQNVAKDLGSLPGRKILVYVGSPVSYIPEEANLSGAVAACNKASVAVYMVDVRRSSFAQNALKELTDGTGGFVIENPNDARGGLERIAHDQDEHYVIAYSPSKSPEESCHTIRVKVDRAGAVVRARNEYCNIKPNDPLAGTQLDKELEARATGTQAGNIAAQMQSSFFYTAPNTARIHLAAIVPTGEIKFVKQNGKFRSRLNVLGIAYDPDGGVGARFSNQVDFDFETNKEVEEFKQHPYQYEGQFEAAAGQYNLKVVFSSGTDSFGKLEAPLVVEPYDANQFAVSGVALCSGSHPASETASLEAVLAANHIPLISRGLQFTPSGSNRYKKTDTMTLYLEVYEPLLRTANSAKVQVQLLVVDRKSGATKVDSGQMDMAARIQVGNPVVPIGLKVPFDSLLPGDYRIDLRATDSAGNVSAVRSLGFQLE